MTARRTASTGAVALITRALIVAALGLAALLPAHLATAQQPCEPSGGEQTNQGTQGQEHNDQTVRTCTSGGSSGSEQTGQESSSDTTSGSSSGASCTTGGGSEVTVTTDEGTRRSSTPDGTVCSQAPAPAPAPAETTTSAGAAGARRSTATTATPEAAPVESPTPAPVVAQATPQIVAEQDPASLGDTTEQTVDEGGSNYGLIALIVLPGILGAIAVRRRQLWQRWAPSRPQVPEHMFLPADPLAQAALRPDNDDRLAGVSVIDTSGDLVLPWGVGDSRRIHPDPVPAPSSWIPEDAGHLNGANGSADPVGPRSSSVIELPFLPEAPEGANGAAQRNGHVHAEADTASLWAVSA